MTAKKASKKAAAAPATTLPQERTHFHLMLAQNPNYFGNVPGSKLKANLPQSGNTTYEQLTCVGYNPDTSTMGATLILNRSNGYGGGLCTHGSFEYVRFYLDFHDGSGFVDQGSVAVNVHDIPAGTDCRNQSTLPLSFSVTKKKVTGKFSTCAKPSLPTLRAILSWGVEPPADSPTWTPPWGNVMDCDVQIKPYAFFPQFEINPDFLEIFTMATVQPDLSLTQISEISGINPANFVQKSAVLPIEALKEKYAKAKVPASRFAFKAVNEIVANPLSEVALLQKDYLSKLKIDISAILDNIGVLVPVDKSKANVDYEELECVGLDYHQENLVATIAIKKEAGYSGDLCDDGSKEYVAFWIDWNDDCTWEYIDTVELKVHDIRMAGDQLCYLATLPLNAKYHRKLCTNPNVVRIRGVLSWNVPPSTTDPNALQFYGNRVDAHVQVKPGIVLTPGDIFPVYNMIGGVSVDQVNDFTGLTKPGSFFEFNGLPVPTGAPFGGLIVLNGLSFYGYRYRIRLVNLNTGSVQYVTNNFTVPKFIAVSPYVLHIPMAVDSDGYYHYLPDGDNSLNILARFTPGTQDMFRVELEIDTVPGVFAKTIQMDNKSPDISIQVDDNGDCTKFKKGDTITGRFFVNDLHIKNWSFGSTWGGGQSGTANTPGAGQPFSIPTNAGSHPCGRISLGAEDKTIIDSQGVGYDVSTGYNICLQP